MREPVPRARNRGIACRLYQRGEPLSSLSRAPETSTIPIPILMPRLSSGGVGMLVDWSSETSPYWVEGKLFREINVEFLQTTVDRRMAYIANQGLVNAMGLGWHSIV